MRWFRHYVGMMRDPKLVGIAARSRQPVERVAFVWGCILEDAAEREAGAAFVLDGDALAYFLRCDPTDVAVILSEMDAAQMVGGGKVTRWADRQYESDSSTARVRRHRERRRPGLEAPMQLSGNGDETLHERDVTAPEAEADSETEKLASPALIEIGLEGLLERCLTAIGRTPTTAPPAMRSPSVVTEWIAAGYDLEADILPTLSAKARTSAGARAKSWQWFQPAVEERHAKRPRGRSVNGNANGVIAAHEPQVWVNEDDPRWKVIAAEYRKHHEGRAPPTTTGSGGLGWWFKPNEIAVDGCAL